MGYSWHKLQRGGSGALPPLRAVAKFPLTSLQPQSVLDERLTKPLIWSLLAEQKCSPRMPRIKRAITATFNRHTLSRTAFFSRLCQDRSCLSPQVSLCSQRAHRHPEPERDRKKSCPLHQAGLLLGPSLAIYLCTELSISRQLFD